MEEEKSEGEKREGGGQRFFVLPSAVNHNEAQLPRQLARERAVMPAAKLDCLSAATPYGSTSQPKSPAAKAVPADWSWEDVRHDDDDEDDDE